MDPTVVVAIRHDFQQPIGKRFIDMIEELTGRNVIAFLSQARVEPGITTQIFFVDARSQGSARSR